MRTQRSVSVCMYTLAHSLTELQSNSSSQASTVTAGDTSVQAQVKHLSLHRGAVSVYPLETIFFPTEMA